MSLQAARKTRKGSIQESNNNNNNNDDDDNGGTVTSREMSGQNGPIHQDRGRHKRIDPVAFLCGLAAGVTQAGALNPYDRALYLSVKNKVPFLSPENFRSPYQGFLQSIGGRALSSGL